MRKMAVAVVLAGVALASVAHGVAAQAATGERFQSLAPTTATQTVPAPAIATPPAQTAAPVTSTQPSAVERFGPTPEGAKLLAPTQAVAEEPKLAHTPAYRRGDGIPLMIVGGALFLAGAIIDDRAGDAVMVAGVVVAAIGLYQYLQ